MSEESMLADFEEVEENPNLEQESEILSMNDPKWSDYVMTHFTEDELQEGNPKTEGLRRVADLVLGPILYSVPRTVATPCEDNMYRAVVEHVVKIRFPDGSIRIFGEVADTYAGNTDDEFARHAPATASTKAEGRALRKALKLRNVVAAEETTSKSVEEAGLTGQITPVQIKGIDAMCARNDIDVISFINSGKLKYKNIQDVSCNAALKMIKRLNEYQRDQSLIPQNIKYYQKDWRNS